MSRFFSIVLLGVAFVGSARGASVDGIELYSTSFGSGPTIVFVHGWTCDTSSWREQIPDFQSDYRVIALDLPGHGRSGSPADGNFSMDLFARAVEAVRAEAGADQILLVGHSMGGPVIRQYAIKYPDRVAGLVAVDGPLDLRGFGGGGSQGGQAPALTREMRESTIRGMFVPDTPVALQEHILTMMLSAPEVTANGAFAAMFDPALRTAEVIAAPALAVVAGTADLPDTEALGAVLPDLEALRIAGTGHFLMMEKPAEFNAVLRQFLNRIRY